MIAPNTKTAWMMLAPIIGSISTKANRVKVELREALRANDRFRRRMYTFRNRYRYEVDTSLSPSTYRVKRVN
jgi:hypothetical protein